jgi:2-haloacid dehalogenase
MASESVPVKALLFDVFGTCVDWRTTVTRALSTAATGALETNTTIDKDVREKAVQMVRSIAGTRRGYR